MTPDRSSPSRRGLLLLSIFAAFLLALMAYGAWRNDQGVDDPVATCADGDPCHSITVGRTLVRGFGDQKLFTDLVTDDPAAFRSEAALRTALAAASAHVLAPDASVLEPQPRACPSEPGDRLIEAQHDHLLPGPPQGLFAACASDYMARYLIVLRSDGSVACIENRFVYSCV